MTKYYDKQPQNLIGFIPPDLVLIYKVESDIPDQQFSFKQWQKSQIFPSVTLPCPGNLQSPLPNALHSARPQQKERDLIKLRLWHLSTLIHNRYTSIPFSVPWQEPVTWSHLDAWEARKSRLVATHQKQVYIHCGRRMWFCVAQLAINHKHPTAGWSFYLKHLSEFIYFVLYHVSRWDYYMQAQWRQMFIYWTCQIVVVIIYWSKFLK